MKLCLAVLAVLLAAPALAQTPPSDPATVMARVMAAVEGIDRPPEEVLEAFLPEAAAQDRLVGALAAQGVDTGDPQAVLFSVRLEGRHPIGYDSVQLTCLRFGPPTLAHAAAEETPPLGPMLMKKPAEGWIGHVVEDLPELGVPQAFPEGAILRQDCKVRFGLPADIPGQALKDWSAAAMQVIEGQFGKVTTRNLGNMAPNPRLSFRASDPKGDGAVQVRLMLGVMPFRPFDDDRDPAFGLELRAATYLFALGS